MWWLPQRRRRLGHPFSRMCPWSFSRNWLGLSPELGQLLGQPVPEGMLFGSFLSTAEPGPALRSGPGAVLAPFGQSLVQVLFCLFQGCLLLLQGFLFCFSCSSADAWAFFKASSFSSKLSGEVQGGVSLGQRSPLHPLPSFPPGLGRWCQRQRPWTCCSFQNLTFSSLVPLVFSNQFSWPFSWPFWQAFSSPGCLPFSKQLFQQLFQVVGFRLFQS